MIAVRSHPRSGTQLIAWYIATYLYPDVDLSRPGSGAGHWSQRYNIPGRSYARLFTGFPHGFKRGTVKAVYAFRDGRDVAVSMWRTKVFRRRSQADMSFSDYLRTPLDWRGAPSQKGRSGTIAEHWLEHVETWTGYGCVHMVRYERLCREPESVVAEVAAFAGVPVEGQVLPPGKMVGMKPHRGGWGSWMDVFDADDLAYFHQRVPANHWALYGGQ